MNAIQNIATAIFSGLAGLIAGVALGAMIVHVPLLFFPGRGAEVGAIVSLGFLTMPIGALIGAIVGVVVGSRRGLGVVAIGSLVAVVGSVVTMGVASYVATPDERSADGCENEPVGMTTGSAADVQIFRHRCPDEKYTLEASVIPRGEKWDFRARGNAVILDVSAETPQDRIAMRVLDGPDSVMSFAFDDRARVTFVAPRIGKIAVRTVPMTTAQLAASSHYPGPLVDDHIAWIEPKRPASPPPDTTDSVPATANPTPNSGFDYVDSIPAKTADGCATEGRGVYIASPYKVTMHKRTCPGERPTLEATLMLRPGRMDFESRGNALIVDASADSAGHPITIDVVQSTPAYVQLAVDRRAKVIFAAKSVEQVEIKVLGGKAR